MDSITSVLDFREIEPYAKSFLSNAEECGMHFTEAETLLYDVAIPGMIRNNVIQGFFEFVPEEEAWYSINGESFWFPLTMRWHDKGVHTTRLTSRQSMRLIDSYGLEGDLSEHMTLIK